MRDRVEAWLHAERDRIALWVPVAFGAGAGGWFLMPDPNQWIAAMLAALAIACAAAAIGRGGRAAHSVAVGGILMAAGVATAWWRAEQVAAPVLARPVVAVVTGRVIGMEALVARDLVRLTIESDPGLGLPPRVRVNLSTDDVPKGLGEAARVRLRARLMPPAAASVPGAYDFARAAWFAGIGATGRGFAPVELVSPGMPEGSLRRRLTAHITDRLEGSRGGIAAALATGDEGAISERDAEAMRRAGLAHLLSVSGLHITAAVAATMFVTLRLLALWPWLAIRVRLPLVAAGMGALAAIGYTLLTGSQVPTIRSCVAALLVLAALAMGREAMTLRLVAAGAMV
ncbi:ComEC/Rec2 family competence protein, partial [Sphingomonas melonis]|uniref:ComEC/Rec2 family competence protein n=1 Tax=Sphingomonas melonis TaxID=152682 RepID=UPI0039C5DC5F